MKSLGLVIVDGVGFRNFILSNFIAQANQHFQKIIIFSGLPFSVFSEIEDKKVSIIELPVFQESSKTWFFRKSKEVAHLQKHKKQFFGIQANLKKNVPKGSSKRALLTKIIFSGTAVLHSERMISALNSLQIGSFKSDPVFTKYFDLLNSTNPDLLFFTHQRPPYLAALNYAAKKLGIKTCSFIFSWDNLASKGRMAAPFDSFLVWSDVMRQELLYFYPSVKKEEVQVVGTPQFEPYVMPEYASKISHFQQKYNLKSGLKTLCYSCGDASTSKNDAHYIETIAQALLAREIPEVNFIVRTSPAEDGSRFAKIKENYPFIKWNFPKWELTRENHPEPWSQRVPLKEDIKDLRALLEFCDLNINMCSTMGLDFMIFDKPVINPVFGNGENTLDNDQRFLQYAHYQRVVQSGAVAIAKNKQELLQAINFSLQNPEARLKKQRELLNLQIGCPLQGTSKRMLESLNRSA